MDEPASKAAQRKGATVGEVAAGGGPGARAAAALVEAGVPATTKLEELRPGSVTQALAEACARELAELYRELDDVYSSAFVDTATDDSTAVNGPHRRRPWWHLASRR